MDTINKILQLVQESGLTAKEYAINAGLGAGNITDWKTGRSKPSVESLQKIAKYAGVQLEWLTGDSEYKTKEEEINILINFTQKESGLPKDIVTASLGQGLGLSLEEDEILNKILSSLSDSVKNNNFSKFDLLKYIKNKDEYTKKRIINALLIIISSQAHVFSRLATNSQKEHISHLKNEIEELQNFLNSNSDYETVKYYMVPVYGRISAGQPNWAEECIEGRLPIDPVLFNIINPEEHFFLRVNGESMNKVIRNGAYALIHKQDIVENGEIAVVLVNGDEATLKKFSKQGDLVVLEPMSDDNSFQVQIYDKNTIIKVLGKYVGKFEINK